MGMEPDYSFNFAVARQEQGQWQALNMPERLRPEATGALSRDGITRIWHQVWQRALQGSTP